METIIFALGEDGVLSVFNDLHEVRLECEGIDVESGVWDFFNYQGKSVRPYFNSPNIIRKHLFGMLKSVESSQNFSFVLNDSEPDLGLLLDDISYLEDNKHFNSIAEVKSYLEKIDY